MDCEPRRLILGLRGQPVIKGILGVFCFLQVAPVGAETEVGNKGHIEFDHAFHLGTYQRFHFFSLGCRNFKEQLIVNLQDHPRLQLAIGQFAIERNHRELDKVSRRALQGVLTAVRSANPREFGFRLVISGIGRTRPKNVRTAPSRRVSSRVFSMKALTP